MLFVSILSCVSDVILGNNKKWLSLITSTRCWTIVFWEVKKKCFIVCSYHQFQSLNSRFESFKMILLLNCVWQANLTFVFGTFLLSFWIFGNNCFFIKFLKNSDVWTLKMKIEQKVNQPLYFPKYCSPTTTPPPTTSIIIIISIIIDLV